MKVFFYDNFLPGQYSGRFEMLQDAKVMASHNVFVTDKLLNADVIICHNVDCEILHFMNRHKSKLLIVCDRFDSVNLGNAKVHVHLPEVTAVFKEFTFQMARGTTVPILLKRYHYALIDQKNPDVTETVVPNKVYAVPWNFAQYSHLPFKSDMKQAGEKSQEKDIDIFCVCHTHSSCAPLKKHRELFTGIVKSLAHRYIIAVDPIKSKRDFIETIKRSKVVVAPYGIGERIATDQFCLLSGGVLVKPTCAHVRTVPNIYQPEYYVPCEPDGSNLVELIDQVMSELPLYQQKSRKARELLDSWTLTRFQNHFFKTLIGVSS